MTENLKHDECKYLATVDAAKGYCHCQKKMLLIDLPVCEKFEALPKCRICANFVGDKDEENLGTCTAGKNNPWTYPDLIASTCEMYTAK